MCFSCDLHQEKVAFRGTINILQQNLSSAESLTTPQFGLIPGAQGYQRKPNCKVKSGAVPITFQEVVQQEAGDPFETFSVFLGRRKWRMEKFFKKSLTKSH